MKQSGYVVVKLIVVRLKCITATVLEYRAESAAPGL